MRRLAMWIVNNAPCRRLAPILFGYAIGSKKYKALAKADEPKTDSEVPTDGWCDKCLCEICVCWWDEVKS